MGIRFAAARAVSAVSTFGLKNVLHRPAANFPGKMALYVDAHLFANLRGRLKQGSVMVVGTNGKTTVTNLLARMLEVAGHSVACNRTGANLDSGVATALLHSRGADWGVFESDELWLAKMTPELRPSYIVLLNLFRDQLDRCGEIDRIQDSIVGALAASPETVLVYNADDPLCAFIAARAAAIPARAGVPSVAFGVAESMGLEQNTVADAAMCQKCSSMFEYGFRQYGQLGDWRCPECGWGRPGLDFAARDVQLEGTSLSFRVEGANPHAAAFSLKAPYGAAYMAYNLLATCVTAALLGVSPADMQRGVDGFNPSNGRLQEYSIAGHWLLLNLAKNPTGFNQNLRIVGRDAGPKAVAFFVNDKEGDGRDVSWLWDIDFEEVAGCENAVFFAGGIRANDVQVRLKYAGIDAELVGDAADFAARVGQLPEGVNVYAIANYTALPGVKAALDAACAGEQPAAKAAGEKGEAAWAAGRECLAHAGEASGEDGLPDCDMGGSASSADSAGPAGPADSAGPVVIVHLFPDLLNLYGDGGNVRILVDRLSRRGIPVRVERVEYGQTVDLSAADLVFLGGGPDREQRLAADELMRMKDDVRAFIEGDGALLAICGGYQLLGSTWLLGDEELPGLGVVDLETRRPGTSADRLIGDIALRSSLSKAPVVGYENHAGRTYLGKGVRPFGSVAAAGHGNNDSDGVDGVLYRNVLGTYLHGPLLSKNPEVADWLLARACERWAQRTGRDVPALAPLDDAQELAANAYMANRLGVKGR